MFSLLIKIQPDATVCRYLFTAKLLCMFRVSQHPSSGVLKTVTAVSGKAVPLQAWSGPEGSRKLRFPDYMTTAQDGGKVISLMHRPPLIPGNVPGTHFCCRLRRPQGQDFMSMKNSSDTSWDRTSDLSICSTAP